MRILVEEYQYDVNDIRQVLHGIDAMENVAGRVSIHYVGYYYNVHLQDCVFILPKVLLKDVDGKELVFGKYKPEDIVNLNEQNPLDNIEKNFLYKFAVWIYRAIVVYRNKKGKETDIIYHAQIAHVGGSSRRLSNTYLDILLYLIKFNRDNQSFIFTTIKNLHRGHNNINWTRTISNTLAIVQDNNPVYLNPVNKKRVVNFDEEILVIFYSILHYIGETYGFPEENPFNIKLITGKAFDTYLSGYGKTRLRQIRYKYFSDKAINLWHLCYAFFDESKQVLTNISQKEYLLAKSFYIVFEAIIDELIGSPNLPDGMKKKQEDGKIVDHLFTAEALIEGDYEKMYYIGDSKYYKMSHELGSESIYKQYTYARNVIQWNLDIFNVGEQPESGIKLRDDVTEGYNIIPNFFISSKMSENFDYGDDCIDKTDRKLNKHKKIQFKNRLFDRDTLLLFHYDVNFLFVLSLYARDNAGQKLHWQEKIRSKFRSEIQDWLHEDYDFYVMKSREGIDSEEYISRNFKTLIGKIYCPFDEKKLYVLALDNAECNKTENKSLVVELKKHFYVAEMKLSENPEAVIEEYVRLKED